MCKGPETQEEFGRFKEQEKKKCVFSHTVVWGREMVTGGFGEGGPRPESKRPCSSLKGELMLFSSWWEAIGVF